MHEIIADENCIAQKDSKERDSSSNFTKNKKDRINPSNISIH